MNKRTVELLGGQIERDDPKCQVTGVRSYGKGSYGLDVVDTRTGVSFVVNSAEQWTVRMDDLRFDEETADAFEN
jgi:chlorite dismutase